MSKSSNNHKQSAHGAGRDAMGRGDTGMPSAAGAQGSGSSGYPLSESIEAPLPQTCCPACQTVFEVPEELLESSDTRVRCGECLSIFDSVEGLLREEFVDNSDILLVDDEGNIIDADSPYARAMAGASDSDSRRGDHTATSDPDYMSMGGHPHDTTDLDVTYSDFDLFSGEVELPEVAYFDQAQDTQHLRFEDPDGDQTFSDTLFSHDLTAEPVDLSPPGARTPILNQEVLGDDVEFVADEINQAPLDFHYRDASGSQRTKAGYDVNVAPDLARHRDAGLPLGRQKTHGKWAMRTTLALVLCVIAGGLYGYRNRDAMLQSPVFRPWAERICVVAGCELAPMVALDSLKVLKRTVFSHPTIENSLVIDLAFVNQATFKQPYPVLEIRLTDLNGGLVIQNDVTPSDYLEQWQNGDLLQAGERLDLSLIVEDPGQLATSFELKFR